jgi:hypothetical protein
MANRIVDSGARGDRMPDEGATQRRGGLVGVPVIAVPTSVGYGAAFQGLAAFGDENSCASNERGEY